MDLFIQKTRRVQIGPFCFDVVFSKMVLDFRMADTESQTSSNNASDCTSVELPPRPHRSQRIDYHLLNGRRDDEGDTESRITKKPRLDLASDRSESVGPGDSASQLNLELPTPSESIPDGSRTFAGGPSDVPHAKARIKQHNHWLWNQFHVSPLTGKLWRPKRGRRLLEDREIQCIRCG